MQEKILSKKFVITLSVSAIAVMAAILIFILNRGDAYRSIMVYQLQGSAVIERADIGALNAAENLYLESGDRVSVEDESMMRMKLDNDKYITAEANTVFALEAEGSSQDSKTRISLEQGAITNEIQNPLSGGSLYETATPNSVMAVRGTIYRAELYDDGEGGQNVRLCCFEGTVAVNPILPDGSMGEEVSVHAGSELTIYNDGTTSTVEDIDYESLPEQAIRILSDMADSGASLAGATPEMLAGLLASSGQEEVSADTEESELPVDTKESELSASAGKVPDIQESGAKSVAAQDDSTTDAGKNSGTENNNNKQKDKNISDSIKTADDVTEQTPQKPGKENTPVPGAPNPSDGSNNGSSDNGDSVNEESVAKAKDDSGDKPKKPDKTVIYTVTFMYEDTVFATQSVEKGGKAVAPMLAPASTGAWDFDFDTKIKANTTIEWKQ